MLKAPRSACKNNQKISNNCNLEIKSVILRKK